MPKIVHYKVHRFVLILWVCFDYPDLTTAVTVSLYQPCKLSRFKSKNKQSSSSAVYFESNFNILFKTIFACYMLFGQYKTIIYYIIICRTIWLFPLFWNCSPDCWIPTLSKQIRPLILYSIKKKMPVNFF